MTGELDGWGLGKDGPSGVPRAFSFPREGLRWETGRAERPCSLLLLSGPAQGRAGASAGDASCTQSCARS